jgi:DivIVA domain-containing protein
VFLEGGVDPFGWACHDRRMGQLLLILVSALVVGAVVFGVSVLITGGDPGLEPAEPDGRAVPLPTSRPLAEDDVARARFDTALRGYRMAQVDQAMSRMAYDIGYKDELIDVLQAEVAALRSGRFADAEVLRRAREAALSAGVDIPDPEADDLAPAVVPPAPVEPEPEPEAEPDAPDQAAAVDEAVDGTVGEAADEAVDEAVDETVDGTADEEPDDTTDEAPPEVPVIDDDALTGRR